MDRAQLAAAADAFDQADAQLYSAEAVEWVTSAGPGLWYAALIPDESTYVVGCNGAVIGQIWRGPGGHLLGGWTAGPLHAAPAGRLGPFHTARAAAAALAAASGVTVELVEPARRSGTARVIGAPP